MEVLTFSSRGSQWSTHRLRWSPCLHLPVRVRHGWTPCGSTPTDTSTHSGGATGRNPTGLRVWPCGTVIFRRKRSGNTRITGRSVPCWNFRVKTQRVYYTFRDAKSKHVRNLTSFEKEVH